jgi:hypothetical protein
MTIREFYFENYPSDEMGGQINENATFIGLYHDILTGGDTYEYLGVSDSLIRERVFEGLANEVGVNYDYIYNVWSNNC